MFLSTKQPFALATCILFLLLALHLDTVYVCLPCMSDTCLLGELPNSSLLGNAWGALKLQHQTVDVGVTGQLYGWQAEGPALPGGGEIFVCNHHCQLQHLTPSVGLLKFV